MASDLKEQLVRLIHGCDEQDLIEVLKTALTLHLSRLQQRQRQIEQEIAQTKKQLAGLSKARKKPAAKKAAVQKSVAKKPARKRRSGPRVSDVIRETLKNAGGPLPLAKIAEAVAKATNRQLSKGLRVYVAQLLKREPAVKRLSRGLYGITV